MLKLDREQALSVGALVALLVACLLMVELSFEARFGAVQSLAERQALIARLEARIKARADAGPPGEAPAAAFVDATTQGLAAAQVQAYLAQVAANQQAVLISSGVETAKREDPAETIRLQATLDVNLNGLQALLFRLESGTPYVFVDSLAMQPAAMVAPTGQPSSAAASSGAPASLLRVTLSLRALWRRGNA
jgi:hypothetical protein